MVKVLLRLEGLALFIASLYFYYRISGNWLLFGALLFVPDIGMVGYVKDTKVGAIAYNFFHNLVLPTTLIVGGVAGNNSFAISIGLILTAHIGMDRLMTYGLKYPTRFKDTHMQKV